MHYQNKYGFYRTQLNVFFFQKKRVPIGTREVK